MTHDTGRFLAQNRRVNVIGDNLLGRCFTCQGRVLCVTAKVIPDMNAFTGLHDYWLAEERGVVMTWGGRGN